MASPAFVAGDFRIFDVKGFKPRMTEIRARLRPKLDAFGGSLAPAVSRSIGADVFEGPRRTLYGQFDRNDRVYLTTTWRF